MAYKLIVIGVSAGGFEALSQLLPMLPARFPIPILIVQHQHKHSDNFLVQYLNERCALEVVEAIDKMNIQSGKVYIAPPGYHLLVEDLNTLALSCAPKVNFSQPSIDVLFESAADIFKAQLIAVILTGANSDGVAGAKKIKRNGGYVVVQSLETAEAKMMPSETLKQVQVNKVLDLIHIPQHLILLAEHMEQA